MGGPRRRGDELTASVGLVHPNIGECTAVCPKEIPLEVIATMNRDYLRGSWRARDNVVKTLRPFTEWSYGSKLRVDNVPEEPASQPAPSAVTTSR